MFHGSMVALVTPMLRDKIDVSRLKKLVEYHISQGTHAIIAAGTTGEAGTLSLEEKLLVIKTVVNQARQRIPVIAGTSANATRECTKLTQMAQDLGVDAALIMSPAYIKPSQEGLYQHYAHIASQVAIPIILYNVPSRTSSDLLPETVARLATISNIIGIKEASGDARRLQALLNACGDKLDVYSGDDLSAAEWMLQGARGVISVTANIVPKFMAKLCDAAADGHAEYCLNLQAQLMPLHQLLFVESNPIAAKWAVNKMGLISDEIRLPLTKLALPHQSAMDTVLRSLNLVE